MQDAVVLEVVGEDERHARGCRRQERSPCPAGAPAASSWSRRTNTFLGLPQADARPLHQPLPGAPGEHQERDADREQQREPAALEELGHVGAEEERVDDEEEAVHGHDRERVVAPLQGDEARRVPS